MKHAIITQREMLDQYGQIADLTEGEFIYYFEDLGYKVTPISNYTKNLEKFLETEQIDLIIIPGGGSIPSKYYDKEHSFFIQKRRDKIEETLMGYSISNKIPVISVCRGAQHLNAYLGGKLKRLENLKEHRAPGLEHEVMIGDKKTILVNSFHNDGIYLKKLSPKLKPLAVDKPNGIVESFYSNELRWLGFQWHPERPFSSKDAYEFTRSIIVDFLNNGGQINESTYFSSR